VEKKEEENGVSLDDFLTSNELDKKTIEESQFKGNLALNQWIEYLSHPTATARKKFQKY
jgi:hypothetical protein